MRSTNVFVFFRSFVLSWFWQTNMFFGWVTAADVTIFELAYMYPRFTESPHDFDNKIFQLLLFFFLHDFQAFRFSFDSFRFSSIGIKSFGVFHFSVNFAFFDNIPAWHFAWVVHELFLLPSFGLSHTTYANLCILCYHFWVRNPCVGIQHVIRIIFEYANILASETILIIFFERNT